MVQQKRTKREIAGHEKFPSENPNTVLRVDEKGTVLFSNPAGQFLLREWNTKVGERVPERIKRFIDDALKSERKIEFEESYGEQTCMFVFAPIINEGYVNIYGIDITERKKAEEALRKNEERYRSYLEATGELGWTTNAEGEVVEDISTWRNFTGQTFEEYKGSGWTKALHPDDLENTLRVWRQAIKQKSRYEVEYRVRRHDGVYRHFMARGVPVFNKDGSLREWVGTCIDITERKKAEEILLEQMDERKKAEEALKESEALYRTLFDHGDDGFILLEPVFDGAGKACDFRFLKVNRAYERQTGRKAHVVEGKMAKEVAPDLEQEWVSLIGEVVKSGKSVRYENYNARTSRWYDAHYFPWAKGQVGILFRDITERKKAAQGLITKQQELKTILDSSPTIIFYKDKDGKIIQANKALAETLNVSRESLLGKTVFDLYSDEIAQAMTNDDLEVMASKRPKLGIVEPYESPTGIRWIRTDKIPSFDENGEVTGLIGFSEEITERKKAEDQLRRQASLIDLSPDAIIVTTVEGTITFWNKGAEKLYGWTKEEAVGKNIHVLLETVFPQALEEILLELKDGKNWTGELTHRTKEGDQVIVQSRWLSEIDKKGEITNILESNIDITQRKVLEKQVKDSERLSAIGKTARMVGHDIRNPLQAIAGDVFLLNNDVASLNASEVKESMLESVKSIKDNLFYIAKIVDDLQDYSKTLKPTYEKVSIEKVISEVMLNVAVDLCRVVINVPEGFPEITSDFSMLKRVLTNLVQNAIQAMPKGGKLMLTAAQKQAKVMISVEDSGVGISKEVKPKLFEPMVSTKAKGQGLGLAVVKRLVEALKGEITFESQVGKGTKFTVSLPIE